MQTQNLKKIARLLLQKCNLGITKYDYLKRLIENENSKQQIEFLKLLENGMMEDALRYFDKSESQILQDIFVLTQTGFKKNGFFVEFGATNGKDLSNTYLLEKEFSWRGILAEPARKWHADLRKNRNVSIETRCVYSVSGKQVNFSEAPVGELSTISDYKDSDGFARQRKHSTNYIVETISLNDLLNTHNAPGEIDYLSIDTEGSEYDILKNLDFDAYRIAIITCEHNFTRNRERIDELLTAKGYVQKLKEFSRFDSWYVHPNL